MQQPGESRRRAVLLVSRAHIDLQRVAAALCCGAPVTA
ncbi:putative leader peptide [Streptacidiphilus monticola]|jgi:hypothetical protein|uniref:Leader peptide n=1 Tax=Streptacidiphilus monticola TaxID=2161674 RepID=A0ABW1FWL8_9ACTN